MTIAEFIEKLQQYPQHMHISIDGSDYGFKIFGFLEGVDRMIELVNGYDPHVHPMLWADPQTLEQKPNMDDEEDCGHKSHEDCLNCSICGVCSESLDEDDVCDGCNK